MTRGGAPGGRELTGSDREPSRRLSTLSLGKNQVKEIGVLEKVNRLSVLDLHDNQVADLGPLAKQTELTV